MAATGDGVSDYIKTATAVTPPAVYSYSFWYLPPNAANTVDTRQPFGMRNDAGAAGAYEATFVWDYPDGTIYKGASHRVGGASYVRCQIQSTPPFGVWILITVTYDGFNVKIYLNETLENTVAAGALSLTDDVFITALSYNGSLAFDDATMASLCVWNDDLTADEVKQIYHGAAPNTIQSGAVIFYAPMNADSDEVTGPNFVNSGCTFNASYFNGMSGGPTIGGPTPAINRIHPEGGISIGGPTPAINRVAPEGGISIGGANINPTRTYTRTPSGGIILGGQRAHSFVTLGNGSFVMQEGRGSARTKK